MDLEQYKQAPLAEEGTFRVAPLARALVKASTGSVAVHVTWRVLQKWHGQEQGWSGEYPEGWYAESHSWVISAAKAADPKTGAPARAERMNEGPIKQLSAAGIWNGEGILSDDPIETVPAIVAQVVVKSESFQGKPQYKVDWINPDSDVPSAGGGAYQPIDNDALSSYRARFGSQMRAIVGGGAAGTAPAPPAQQPELPVPPITGNEGGAPVPPQPSAPQPPIAPPTQTVAPPPQMPPAGPPAAQGPESPPAPPVPPALPQKLTQDGLPDFGGDPGFIPEADGTKYDPILGVDEKDIPF